MIKILSVTIDSLTCEKTLMKIEGAKRPLFVVTLNPEILLHAWRDPAYQSILNSADIRVIDGFGIVLMARLLYGVKLERFAGADLANEIVKIAAQKGWRVFLLGGREETNEKAIKNIISNFQFPISLSPEGRVLRRQSQFSINQFPNVGGLGGEFNDKEAIKEIMAFKPDILLVALGAPKQEILIHKLSAKSYQLKAITMGIGGAIDYWAYPWLRAPHIVRRIGLEWLWRLALQPWRFPRIFNAIILFPLTCLYEWILLKWRNERH